MGRKCPKMRPRHQICRSHYKPPGFAIYVVIWLFLIWSGIGVIYYGAPATPLSSWVKRLLNKFAIENFRRIYERLKRTGSERKKKPNLRAFEVI